MSVSRTIAPRPDMGPKIQKARISKPKTAMSPQKQLGPFPDQELQSTDRLRRLRAQLKKSRRVVVISGAGISVSAGSQNIHSFSFERWSLTYSAVPDFQGLRTTGCSSLDVSALKAHDTTEMLFDTTYTLCRASQNALPTDFHKHLARLAQDKRLLRHYTQNIDCLEERLPALWERTLQLHGRVDRIKCQLCSWVGALTPSAGKEASDRTNCPDCGQRAALREALGRRRITVGRVRPGFLLYGEECSDAESIGRTATSDMRQIPDAVIVAGTRLKVPGARTLVRQMCKTTRAANGTTVWISTQSPEASLRHLFDVILQEDCDRAGAVLFA